MDIAQCLSFNTVCEVTRYRGFDPSLNMNKIHLSVSLSLSHTELELNNKLAGLNAAYLKGELSLYLCISLSHKHTARIE